MYVYANQTIQYKAIKIIMKYEGPQWFEYLQYRQYIM